MKNVPKQFKHWCENHGIYEDRKYKGCFKGRRRVWRINADNKFDMSETYRTFDRWANSRVKTCDLPQTEAEFNIMMIEMKDSMRWPSPLQLAHLFPTHKMLNNLSEENYDTN